MTQDLTDKQYWESKQIVRVSDQPPLNYSSRWEWFDEVAAAIKALPEKDFLELGCSPGHVSAALVSVANVKPEGVDFADTADQYIANLKAVGVEQPILYRCDLREFNPPRLYNVVGSFGLVEHFGNSDAILDLHSNLVAPGGMCVIEVPNFKGFPGLYQRLCDPVNLSHHNLNVMKLEVFERFAKRQGHRIVKLKYCGRLRLWGIDRSGPFWQRLLKLGIAGALRIFARCVSPIVPEGHAWFAPWILYIGVKKR
jgi:2-polyprenyl-3-methyl-5-hydroxy-6-metoxy-1,4-benzoquinol methylase